MADQGGRFLVSRKTYPPNTVLCREGETCDSIYLLLRGSIQVVSQDRVIRTIDQPGTFVGELTPLFNQPRGTTLVTREQCECIEVPTSYLEDLLEQSPDEGVSLLGIVAERLLRKSEAFRRLEQELSVLRSADEEPSAAAQPAQLRRVILVAAEPLFTAALNYHLVPIGYQVEHMSDPVAVMNNLEELHPDLMIVNGADFPRQWKPLLKLLRDKWGPEESVFILLTPDDFEFDEAAKAAYLNINGLLPVQALSEQIVYRLEELLKRYKSIQDKRKSPRIAPSETEKFELLFTHPGRLAIVGGVVADVSLDGTRFFPWDPALTRDLKVDERIRGCSLRIGGQIVTVNCRVVRNGSNLGLEFESFEGNGDQTLFQYLVERPERELRVAAGRR
jgi:CRP-like cAMP-binding protein